MSVVMMEASPPLLSASDGLVLDLLAASDSGRERERDGGRMNDRRKDGGRDGQTAGERVS